jgi:hypothetical protein
MTVNSLIVRNYFGSKNIGFPTADNHRLTTAIALMRKRATAMCAPYTPPREEDGQSANTMA